MANEIEGIFGSELSHYKYAWVILEGALLTRPKWTAGELTDLLGICKSRAVSVALLDKKDS